MVNLVYQPFLRRGLNYFGTQQLKVSLSDLAETGLLLVANTSDVPIQVNEIKTSPPKFLKISWQDRYLTLPWKDLQAELGQINSTYSALYRVVHRETGWNEGYWVQFNDLEFLWGAQFLLEKLGLNFNHSFPRIFKEGVELALQINTHLGILNLTGPISELLPLNSLSSKLGSIYPSYKYSLETCFPQMDIALFLPSDLYVMTSDPSYTQIISSASVTPNLSTLPKIYQTIGGRYIYGVCTSPEYQGQGKAKSILIAVLNNLILDDSVSEVYLEVDPENTRAYQLYTGLGFTYAASTWQHSRIHHLLQMSV